MNKISKTAPIGVFDSGLGGLTVVAALDALLPHEDIIYLGDTARVPYGDKSPETVGRFGLENALALLERDVKMIVVACNTVSATALPFIQSELEARGFRVPILGVVDAGIEAIIPRNPRKICVLGTRATIASGAYERGIRAKLPDTETISIPCPILAPIVEDGLANHPIATSAIKHYLTPILDSPPDTLLLGCTHYPLLIDAIRTVLPPSITIVDSSIAIAEKIRETLEKLDLAKIIDTSSGRREFLSTDSPRLFAERAKVFLDGKLSPMKVEEAPCR